MQKAMAAQSGSLSALIAQIPHSQVLLAQRVRAVVDELLARTAHEAKPLSRERMREVLRQILAEPPE